MHFDLPTPPAPGGLPGAQRLRVLPARLLGHRISPPAARVEQLLLIDRGDKVWECLVRPGRKLKPGTRLSLRGRLPKAEVVRYARGQTGHLA